MTQGQVPHYHEGMQDLLQIGTWLSTEASTHQQRQNLVELMGVCKSKVNNGIFSQMLQHSS